MSTKNTYRKDEVLEEPFDIKHLLRASSYIKKYLKLLQVALRKSLALKDRHEIDTRDHQQYQDDSDMSKNILFH